MMQASSRIYIAGHTGLAGSALLRQLQAAGYARLITRRHADLDLTDKVAVADFFAAERPEYAFIAAAKVGGILANDTFPAEFIHENLAIQNNVIHEAFRAGVKRLLFLGSSCVYPRDCPQPIKEDALLTGPLEPTNRPYALAKIAGIEMCHAYNRQHHTRFLCVMPTNLYGPNDNYDLETSHVLPAVIRKMHEAKLRGDKRVLLWGTGVPKREFLHSSDMADACLFLMNLADAKFHPLCDRWPPIVNIGAGEDMTVRELAELVRRTVGFTGEIAWDPAKPDGTPRKLLDIARLSALGWRPRMELAAGVAAAYRDFLQSAAPKLHRSDVQRPV